MLLSSQKQILGGCITILPLLMVPRLFYLMYIFIFLTNVVLGEFKLQCKNYFIENELMATWETDVSVFKLCICNIKKNNYLLFQLAMLCFPGWKIIYKLLEKSASSCTPYIWWAKFCKNKLLGIITSFFEGWASLLTYTCIK